MNDLHKASQHRLFLILFPLAIILLIIFQQSCNKDDECTVPQLDSITLEDSTQRIDYLIPTTRITLHGSNFTDLTTIYFNKLQYDVRYIYHSDTTFSFEVPYVSSNSESTDSLKISKSCGISVLEVHIMSAPPYIESISNERAMAGDIITLEGKYFIDLESVSFPSCKTGEIVEGYNDTVCQVIVPDGVINEGKLILTSTSGSSTSAYAVDFWDRSGLLCNFDDFDTWDGWGGNVICGSQDPSIPKASGYFFVCELSDIAPDSLEIESSTLPVTILSIPNYSGELTPDYFAIQTEMYLKYPWKCGYYKILFGKKNDEGETDYSYEYNYQPWSDSLNKGEFTTDGWETVTIPLTDFMLSSSSSVYLQSFSQLRLINYMQWNFVNPAEEDGGVTLTHFKIAIDNIRLVQIKDNPD